MTKDIFSLGLNEHRRWGYIFTPYIINKSSEGNFFYTSHSIFPKNKDESFQLLTKEQQEIVCLTDEYSEQNLFKLFSRNKNVKEFLDKVDDIKIENFIRPYIEKRMAKIFDILISSEIKIFHRDKSRSNIFDEDFLKTYQDVFSGVFFFEKLNEGTRYKLEISSKKNKLKIKDPASFSICDFPAILCVNKHLLRVRDIDSKKIRPFFARDFIIVPKNFELKYYKSFVLNTIHNFEVFANGFQIIITQPEKKVLLSLEAGLNNNAVLILRFLYGGKTIHSNYSPNCFVEFYKDKNEYRFEKILRDFDFEKKPTLLLKQLGYESADEISWEIPDNKELPFEEQLYYLIESINKNNNKIVESGIVYSQNVTDKKFFLGSVTLNLSADAVNDWFDIHAIAYIGDFQVPFLKFRKNILNNIREYVLPNGEIFILPIEWFSRYKEVFEFGKNEGDRIRIHKQHFFILDKAESSVDIKKIKKLEKLTHSDRLPLADLPKGLTARLRNYQHEGYTWLLYLQNNNLGGCLADDMGLGKTIQTIALILNNKECLQQKKQSSNQTVQQLELFSIPEESLVSLIIVPASLVHNWINEIRKFGPSLKVYPHIGNQRNKSIRKFHLFDIIISSYHTIRQDVDLFSDFKFNYIILDESQVIKNPSSKIYKAIEMLKSDHKLALTGTPIENSLTDLWAQMNFVNNGLLGNQSFFKKEFAVPIEKKKQLEKEEKLKTLIKPYILRRKKEEVATELPPVSEQIIYCSMTEEQRKFYDSEKAKIRNTIFEKIENRGIEKSSIIVLQGLTKLRQIANHPLLVDDEYPYESGKFNEVSRNIENVISEGHKVLIFSSFVKHLEIIENYLKKEKILYTLLTGASTGREGIVKKFQENDNCRVFLISLKAGGVGLNLTAADYVFLIDPWWNPASEIQALSRSHRIGQIKNVFVFRFISENSIEEKILKLQGRKNKLAETFIRSNNPMKEISKNELEGLFE